MAPMYLGRWIAFYIYINDHCLQVQKEEVDQVNQFCAGTKGRRRKFKDEAHSEEIPRESVHCKSISPS
jgi:hypothetical protein